jgi:hypothetical protein
MQRAGAPPRRRRLRRRRRPRAAPAPKRTRPKPHHAAIHNLAESLPRHPHRQLRFASSRREHTLAHQSKEQCRAAQSSVRLSSAPASVSSHEHTPRHDMAHITATAVNGIPLDQQSRSELEPSSAKARPGRQSPASSSRLLTSLRRSKFHPNPHGGDVRGPRAQAGARRAGLYGAASPPSRPLSVVPQNREDTQNQTRSPSSAPSGATSIPHPPKQPRQ